MFRRLSSLAWLLSSTVLLSAAPPFHLGLDVDNWSNQIQNPQFEASLHTLGIDFLSWHISPDEEKNPQRLNAIITFCRRNNWSYLFNTEVANYVPHPIHQHPDGTYRYDLQPETLALLKDDPLFLGVVYDESELMQSMLGVQDAKGKEIQPYLADTRNLSPKAAFDAVSAKVADLTKTYASYGGKRVIFEMVFPANPFPMARGGALLAPKLLKENYNDLMYAIFRGASLEYSSRELWACIDLWLFQNFPLAGNYGPGFHTPAELLDTLKFTYTNGFDYVYIERQQALATTTFQLTEYGQKVVEFQTWRKTHPQGNWRTEPITEYIKRFPDGYWGQDFSPFFPDHPYGSWTGNPYRKQDEAWFKALNQLSNGAIPTDADTWNALKNPFFSTHPYRPIAGLPNFVEFDNYGVIPKDTKAKVLDLTSLPTSSPSRSTAP